MSTLAVVEEILRETAVPMSVREIVERAGVRLPSKSKTPDTVVARDLSMDIKKKGEDVALRSHVSRPLHAALARLVDRAARRRRDAALAGRAAHRWRTRAAADVGAARAQARRRRVALVGARADRQRRRQRPRRLTSLDATMIRRAEVADHPWIIATGAEAYHDLGDYTRILPSWLEQPGVLAWIDHDVQGRGRGFAMLGFYLDDPSANPGARSQVVADLLALAVLPSVPAPRHRHQAAPPRHRGRRARRALEPHHDAAAHGRRDQHRRAAALRAPRLPRGRRLRDLRSRPERAAHGAPAEPAPAGLSSAQLAMRHAEGGMARLCRAGRAGRPASY